ncbi:MULTISPECIES: response regulator transcription factor [unclassified Burkholderia]|uniref:response regulator transcription factor n=1 Tax=unclassified Burkholderia TaxID=2613784 RepID=UPI001588E858|nr:MULTISPECIES: response regulator transcription factor [unclassified Burkholderia]
MRILVIDGGRASGLIPAILREQGCEVTAVESRENAVRLLQQTMFDFVILAWVFPNGSASNLLHWIRANLGPHMPVAVLVDDSTGEKIAEALNSGADDVIAKSVGRTELVARVNALVRRTFLARGDGLAIRAGGYLIPNTGTCIYINGNPVRMTRKEMDIIVLLFQNIGKIVPRKYLIEAVWGRGGDMVSRSLDTHMYRVRNKLKLNNENGLMLRSVFSVGYKLESC